MGKPKGKARSAKAGSSGKNTKPLDFEFFSEGILLESRDITWFGELTDWWRMTLEEDKARYASSTERSRLIQVRGWEELKTVGQLLLWLQGQETKLQRNLFILAAPP